MVKAGYLFAFEDTTARSPLYAFPLVGTTITIEDPLSPSDQSYTISPAGEQNLALDDLRTVLLFTPDKRDKVAFQITFVVRAGEEDLVKQFIKVVENASKEELVQQDVNTSKLS